MNQEATPSEHLLLDPLLICLSNVISLQIYRTLMEKTDAKVYIAVVKYVPEKPQLIGNLKYL